MKYLSVPEQATTALVRSRDVVHTATCYQVRGRFVNPWYWAEGKPNAEIARAADNGIKFCRTCNPLGTDHDS